MTSVEKPAGSPPEQKPELFLIPNRISDADAELFFSAGWRRQISHIRYFIVEDVRSARRFLSALKIFPPMDELTFSELNVQTPSSALPSLMKPLHQGHPMGVISESGCPGVADPGAWAVAYAHDHGIAVRPLTGPSSIILALMASGMNGQRFSFNGYLPIDARERLMEIQRLEKISTAQQATQVFIESPHRNARLLETLLGTLSPNTRLAVAVDLTGESERIVSLPVRQWKARPVEALPKLPCIFLFQA